MYQNIYVDVPNKKGVRKVYLWDDTVGLIVSDYEPYAYKKNPLGKYSTITGEKVDKVYGGFSYGESGYFEADIPPITRILIDCYGDSDEPSKNHRILFLDIETETAGGYPKIDIAQQPITAVALYDFNIKKYICLVLDTSKTLSGYEESDKVVKVFYDEENLLKDFIETYAKLNPTILSGWNIVGFDIPYLINRITRVLGQEWAYRLSPICLINKDEIRGNITIAGVSVLDYLDLYKKFTVGVVRLPNYRLDTVAEHELGEKKIKYDGSLGNLLRTDIKKFIEYNIRDVYLVIGIDKKNKFIDLAMALSHVGHIRYEDFSVSSRLLEGALLTYLRRNNLVAPNKPDESIRITSSYVKELENMGDSEDEDDDDLEYDSLQRKQLISLADKGFEGAYVKEPVPGRYDWIFSCDINSLYPSTIMSLNISPETLIGQVSKWKAKDYASGNFESVHIKFFSSDDDRVMTKDEFLSFIKENNYSIAANGALYRQDFDGLLKNILVKWYSERVEFKKKAKEASDNKDSETEAFYNMRQMVQKILLNSLYGVLGLQNWRFFNIINAEAVTISGQNIIKTSEMFVDKKIKSILGRRIKVTYEDGMEEFFYENQKNLPSEIASWKAKKSI
jgi:DNA polymerase elongation subunit (family B)